MPNSALIRFLKQGLAKGMCPLCRVAHKADAEFMWHFFDDYSGQAWALEALRGARGFCAAHAAHLRRIEFDGLRSTLGMSGVYLDTLEGVSAQLRQLDPRREPPPPSPCPACSYRDDEVETNARYLLEMLAEDEHSRERFASSPGLCLRHFDLVWRAAGTDGEREFLLEVERRCLDGLAEKLREHIRKEGHEAKHEPKGAERDAWQRALFLTGGWTPGWEEVAREALEFQAPAGERSAT